MCVMQRKVILQKEAEFRMSVNFPFNKVGDRTGQITAEMNISDLKALVGGENDSREL